ncbi:MAG: SRPBCC family protein [Crocinitomicaceae bacterium]
MAYYQKHQTQKVNATIDEVWDFISSPANLKEITPKYMGFDIVTKNLPEKMYKGMIIGYKVSPVAGIKTTWVTEITNVVDKKYFVDEQRIGPYAMWHHQHFIEPLAEGGVLMTDIVTYQPPFGFLGSIANSILIKKKLNEIFEFRTLAMEKKFGTYND